MSFDIERMNKLPPEARFLDVNDFWCFPNRWVVKFLYPLSITPTQITILSLVAGLVSVYCYMIDSSVGLMWGALFLYLKIFLDNVDGNLARVKGEVSRLGRFLDSLIDFIVSFLVYLVLTLRLVSETSNSLYWFLGGLAFLSCLIHCSYFVFYLVQYTSISGTYLCNRADESITEEDLASAEENGWNLRLQKIFAWSYGWQDRLIERLDFVSRKLAGVSERDETAWYGDRFFLSAISPLCLCTNNVMLAIFSLVNQVELFLILLILVMNFYGIGLLIWKIQKWKTKNAI